MKTSTRPNRAIALVALAATLMLGACSGAAAPAPTSAPSAASPSAPAPSDAPGGDSPGDPGTVVPGSVDPAPADPGTGHSILVIPKPGQLNPRPLPASSLVASVDGRRVLVKATWWSGIEPCNVLDSVKVERAGNDIAITLIEGTGDPGAICIEIAILKATIVDLGELEPGTYTITSPGGDAPPVTVTVG